MNQAVEFYLSSLIPERKQWLNTILEKVQQALPYPFELGMQYRMPSFYISRAYYPQGYHVGHEVPLPFFAIASQKQYVSIYFMPWMTAETNHAHLQDQYINLTGKKLNTGKVCFRFKKPEDIPLQWLTNLVQSVSADTWISLYEASRIKDRKSRKT